MPEGHDSLGERVAARRDRLVALTEQVAQAKAEEVASATAADVAATTATDIATTTATDIATTMAADVAANTTATIASYVDDRISQIVAENKLVDPGPTEEAVASLTAEAQVAAVKVIKPAVS